MEEHKDKVGGGDHNDFCWTITKKKLLGGMLISRLGATTLVGIFETRNSLTEPAIPCT